MKIAFILKAGDGSAVADRCPQGVVNRLDDSCEAIYVDQVMTLLETDLPIINTNIAVQNFIAKKDVRDEILNLLEIEEGTPRTYIFSLFNGEDYSEWMELCFSDRFMNDNIGPRLGFTVGSALRIPFNMEEVSPQLTNIKNFLQSIEYKGQLLIGLDRRRRVNFLGLGHFTGQFALYSELARQTCPELLEFCLGKVPGVTLHSSLGVALLVSQPPFPYFGIKTERLRAPQEAEKRLWRIPVGMTEAVLITTHGATFREARNRLSRTVSNLKNGQPFLQYRTDLGRVRSFLLTSDIAGRLFSEDSPRTGVSSDEAHHDSEEKHVAPSAVETPVVEEKPA